jgi:methionine synthase I (cobalamin-dependent)/5,10-methylenetetrahydrofolate reductase
VPHGAKAEANPLATRRVKRHTGPMTRARFLDALSSGAMVFDGAMGTQLHERGGAPNKSFDEMCLSQRDLVESVHRAYLHVGVDVIQTNSYGANRIGLASHGLADRVVEICSASVAAARAAITHSGSGAFVAGSVGPSGLRPKDLMRARTRRQVFDAFREQASALVQAGADCLVFETFAYLGELELAVEAAYGLDVPLIAQARFGQRANDSRADGHLDQTDDGATPEEVVARMVELGVDVVGANCALGPEALLDVVARMVVMHKEGKGPPVIMQPNVGQPRVVDGRTLFSSPETYGVVARRAFKLGVNIVGGCCGTGPEHIRRVVAAARMVSGRAPPAPVVSSSSRAQGMEPTPFAGRSRLSQRLADGKFIVSVELLPPTGLDPSATLEKIGILERGGVDAVNIPDGPRATVRMSNLVLARTVVEKYTRIEPILHVCARDRNLLALQADLIGAHVSGIRNTVIITGDPPKVGDYPDATAVFDLDSIGLLGMANGLNRGLDPAGKSMKGQTSFVLMTGAEPAALDIERELSRLQDKRAAGAELVMTQPVFDPETLMAFLARCRPLGLKVVVGILPLASSRNAEFLHHHVPGMRIPDDVRARMAKAGEGPAAAAEGVAIAAEALRAIRQSAGDQVAGAYIMPPFSRVELALQVLERL